jgi:hypothetical protein
MSTDTFCSTWCHHVLLYANSWGIWSVHWRTYLIRFARWSSSQLAFVPNTFNNWSSSSGSRCCGRWFNVIGKASELVLLALAHLNNVAIEIELSCMSTSHNSSFWLNLSWHEETYALGILLAGVSSCQERLSQKLLL